MGGEKKYIKKERQNLSPFSFRSRVMDTRDRYSLRPSQVGATVAINRSTA